MNWLDSVIAAFKKQTGGDTVVLTDLSSNNAQTAAKLDAAFASGAVPNMMILLSGSYTTYYAGQLLNLKNLIKSKPGFYNNLADWTLSCGDLYNCKGGNGKIYGVPIDGGAYVLFYNKALFAKAGIKRPPATYKQMYADCAILKKDGIDPMSYGDVNGYETSNLLTSNLVSTLSSAKEYTGLLSGKVSYASPAVVSALQAITKLPTKGCVSPTSFTTEQINGSLPFQSGKAAMTDLYNAFLPQFEHELGSKLGVARQPVSGDGPLLKVGTGYTGDSFDNFVIPKNAPNAKLSWEFIKLAMSTKFQTSMEKVIGLAPSNKTSSGAITDPIAKFIAELSTDPPITELDQAMSNPDALYFYAQLHLAFDGSETAKQAMTNVQNYAVSQRASSGGGG